MYTERKIKISQFQPRKNPQAKGCLCQLCSNTFIDYNEECYIHPQLKIIICKKCRKAEVKPLKYRNQITEYNKEKFDSKLEAGHAGTLDLLKRIKQIKDWEKQKKIEFNIRLDKKEPILTTETRLELKSKRIKHYHLFNYYVDFVVYHNDGSIEYQETKGYEQKLWQAKWICTQACFKDKIKLTVLKEQSFKPKRKAG